VKKNIVVVAKIEIITGVKFVEAKARIITIDVIRAEPGLGDPEFCFYKFSKNKILLL
jgi:hypothetical protein